MLSLSSTNAKMGVGFTVGVAVGALVLSLARGGCGKGSVVARGDTGTKDIPAKNDATPDKGASTTSSASDQSVYETAKAVAEYLQFHYGEASDILPFAEGTATPTAALQFPKRCAAIVARFATAHAVPMDRALDVGCAVGAQSFALARHFKAVVGLDFSHAFVKASKSMQTKGSASYEYTVESDITATAVASVPKDIDRSRVSFEQGDACNIRTDIGKFNIVFAGNLLCRLPDPRKFLARLPDLVEEGGLVVIVSPYSWLSQYTAKDKWIGGYMDGKTAVESSDRLREIMEPHFELLGEEDVPFLIREHRRKYQWGCSEGLVWKKR